MLKSVRKLTQFYKHLNTTTKIGIFISIGTLLLFFSVYYATKNNLPKIIVLKVQQKGGMSSEPLISFLSYYRNLILGCSLLSLLFDIFFSKKTYLGSYSKMKNISQGCKLFAIIHLILFISDVLYNL